MKPYYQILRELREDNDFTQTYIAGILYTNQRVYSNYENGIREMPLHHLITLCKFYNVSADYVLGLTSKSR